jgi:2'-5' RNA ligase/GNAT superfamily N-acetyltransferase
MARLRLGVALLVPSPAREEIDGLRRALGDPALGRVPAHLTLVPPVNVRQESLGEALATLRRAAAAGPGRLTLTLGPVTTFLPGSPVIYLAVGGDLEALHGLRDRVFSGPLERPLSWPFVPHVTLADQADPDGIPAAVATLSRYQALVTVEAVHLLQEAGHGTGRRWEPLADAALGPPAVIGRGGLALELTRSRMLDPEARALVGMEPADGAGAGAGAGAGGGRVAPDAARPPIVITGRREGEVVGVAAVWLTDDGAGIGVLVAGRHRRQGIGGHLLAAAEATVADEGWRCRQLAAVGPPAFYRARSRWSVVGCYSKAIDE